MALVDLFHRQNRFVNRAILNLAPAISQARNITLCILGKVALFDFQTVSKKLLLTGKPDI
jgi:hypothetical protein